MTAEPGLYLVVTQDTVIQSREYAVYADSETDAKQKIRNGQFIIESSATTMDTLESNIIKTEKV